MWLDVSGNGFHSDWYSGEIQKVEGTPNYLFGDTGDRVCLSDNDIIASTFTICTLSKYMSPEYSWYRRRIVQGRDDNWYHGHNSNSGGVAYYRSNQVSSATVGNNLDWMIMCGQNGGSMCSERMMGTQP